MYPRSNFVGCGVEPVSCAAADHLVRAHYLGRWPGVAVLTLGMFNGAALVGVVVFALPPRETMKRYKVSLAWELARLFVLGSEPFNSETWFMARAIGYIRKHRPDVELLVSYADPSRGHKGTIYKAGNWKQDGRTNQERKTPRFDYLVNGKVYSRRGHVPEGAVIERVPRISKFRFVYPLASPRKWCQDVGK